jgi:hypothetical protein
MLFDTEGRPPPPPTCRRLQGEPAFIAFRCDNADSDDVHARNPWQSICAGSAAAGAPFWAKARAERSCTRPPLREAHASRCMCRCTITRQRNVLTAGHSLRVTKRSSQAAESASCWLSSRLFHEPTALVPSNKWLGEPPETDASRGLLTASAGSGRLIYLDADRCSWRSITNNFRSVTFVKRPPSRAALRVVATSFATDRKCWRTSRRPFGRLPL